MKATGTAARRRKALVRACVIVAALTAGVAAGGGAGFIAFGLASDFKVWTPQRDGFAAGYEALGVAFLFTAVGACVGACGGLGLSVWQIRRLGRSTRP